MKKKLPQILTLILCVTTAPIAAMKRKALPQSHTARKYQKLNNGKRHNPVATQKILFLIDNPQSTDYEPKIVQLLQEGGNPNAKNSSGTNILTRAVKGNHLKAIAELLSRGAKTDGVKYQELDFTTYKKTEVAKLFKAHKKQQCKCAKKYSDIFIKACHDGDLRLATQTIGAMQKEVTSDLFFGKAKFGLICAAKNKNWDLVFALIEDYGFDVDFQSNIVGVLGQTVLHFAVKERNVQAVERLLQLGASPFASSLDQDAPIKIANKKNDVQIKRIINKYLYTNPITYKLLCGATKAGWIHYIKMKLPRNLEVFDDFKEGDYGPLCLAISNGHFEVIAYLLEQARKYFGANKFYNFINQFRDNGWTLLHWVSWHGIELSAITKKRILNAPLIAKILVHYGANVNKESDCNYEKYESYESPYTPLHLAAYYGDSEWVSELINNACEIDAIESSSDLKITPLFFAIEQEHSDVVKLLLEKGAQVNPTYEDYTEYCPLLLALKDGTPEIASILRSHGAKLTCYKCGKYFDDRLLYDESISEINNKLLALQNESDWEKRWEAENGVISQILCSECLKGQSS